MAPRHHVNRCYETSVRKSVTDANLAYALSNQGEATVVTRAQTIVKVTQKTKYNWYI